MYELHVDKDKLFECSISLDGASIKNAKSRIIVEGPDKNLVFYGNIDKNGKCKVNIERLNELLDEDDTGNMLLEVIVDDIYFSPWKSDFTVTRARKLKVEVIDSKSARSSVKKPKIQVKVEGTSNNDPIVDIIKGYKGKINNKQLIEILSTYKRQIGNTDSIKYFIGNIVNQLNYD